MTRNRAQHRRDRANPHADFEFPPRRQARRGDRWWVRRSPRGTWLAGPKRYRVYVDPACLHLYLEFATWTDALAFAFTRAGARR